MRPLSILVVDDDADFARSLANFLRLEGNLVALALDGEAAVAKFTEQDFDITFMDVRLPGKNGVESFFEIRRLKPAAKVVMMTAHGVEELDRQWRAGRIEQTPRHRPGVTDLGRRQARRYRAAGR